MKTGPWITHGLVLAAGFAAALALAGKGSPAVDAKATAAGAGKQPTTRATRHPVEVRPRDLLRSMATMPMESMERYRLKEEIYADWSTQDPLGFLAHFEHRPWFGYMDDEHPFRILAKTQPEELLAYARRTGCEEAASVLIEYADPRHVLELIQQGGTARLTQDLLKKLAEKGEEVDPLFHEKLSAIADPDARKAALAESASVMKETGRLDDLLKLIEQHPDVLNAEDAGESIGHLLLMDRRELGRLDSLDAEVREAAVEEMIHSLHDDQVSGQDQRQILTDLATCGDLDARRKEVFEGILEQDDVSPESAVAWKDWALGLPKSERTRPLQLASMALWSLSTRAEAADFEAIPEGELRDGAVVGGVGRYLPTGNLTDAGRMAALIDDPDLREKMKGYLAQLAKDEEPEDFDPFGFEEK